jgi:hypothetical protein
VAGIVDILSCFLCKFPVSLPCVINTGVTILVSWFSVGEYLEYPYNMPCKTAENPAVMNH